MGDHNFPVFFSEWLRLRRKMLDLTQEELALRAGCSVFALRKIESGERRPSKQLAGLIADALEIPAEDRLNFIRIARRELNLERLEHLPLQQAVPLPGLRSIPDSRPPPLASKEKPEKSASPPPRHLPSQSTPLIGRELEVSALERRFNDPQCRLLTLTGIGGIGKTRLALEFAARQSPAFAGGGYYFPLTAVNSPEAIPPAMAEVLGFVFSGPSTPYEQLLDYIARRFQDRTLFILDNLEHLLGGPESSGNPGGLSELVSQILQRAPQVRILATSRERLNLQGEWMFELHGLSVPPAGFTGQVEAYNATAFFFTRARRARDGFQASGPEQAALVRICQMVDGVPLAIELAAAWVGVLSCQEIAQEIQSNMDFLTTSMRDIPERHRSMRATFDHSWKLLTGDERQVLCQLSVFRSGFNRHAASHIAGATLPLLASLVDKSLVRRSNSHRYDLHEVIRQYSQGHLSLDPNCSQTCRQHGEYYLSYTCEREQALKSERQQEAMRQLTSEIDNILAAWAWAIQEREFDLAAQAGRAFGWYFEIAGLYHEGIEQLELAVQALKAGPQPQAHPRLLGLALVHQALLLVRKGGFERAATLYEESIALLRTVGDKALLADALDFLAILMHMRGNFERSIELVTEGRELAHQANAPWFEAFAIYNLGHIDGLMGLYEQGRTQMLAGLEIWRRLGDPQAISMGLSFLVPTLISLGRFDEAKAVTQESIALCEQSRNRWGMATAYRFLGLATLAGGSPKEAQTHFRKSLEIFGESFAGWDIARTLAYLGDAIHASGEIPEARQTYRRALHLAMDAQAAPIAMDALFGLGVLEMQAGDPLRARMLLQFVIDNPCTEFATRERTTRLCSDLDSILLPDQTASARLQAHEKTLEMLALEETSKTI